MAKILKLDNKNSFFCFPSTVSAVHNSHFKYLTPKILFMNAVQEN
uniref:Uncharacterized protein n=1 Tax=Rhizophora mucronata TaxID=61149 RepID=A0A2P2R4H3_RHIMU